MRAHRWADFLSRVTYKQGWTFEYEEYYGDAYLVVSYPAVDADRPKSKTTIYGKTPIFESLDNDPKSTPERYEKYMLSILLDAIKRAEEHEREEWLRINGLRVYNPHPEQRTEELWQPGSMNVETANTYGMTMPPRTVSARIAGREVRFPAIQQMTMTDLIRMETLPKQTTITTNVK